jgi:hypothetical protein
VIDEDAATKPSRDALYLKQNRQQRGGLGLKARTHGPVAFFRAAASSSYEVRAESMACRGR